MWVPYMTQSIQDLVTRYRHRLPEVDASALFYQEKAAAAKTPEEKELFLLVARVWIEVGALIRRETP